MYTVIIYTSQNVIEFEIKYEGTDLAEQIKEAIDQGLVMLETVRGTQLIVNPLDVVAIEVSTPHID